MSTALRSLKLKIIDQLFESVDANNTVLYVFAGHGTPWTDDNNPPAATDSIDDAIFNTRQGILFGKRITTQDMSRMTARYDWVANSVYSQYDNSDHTLFDDPFFVVTDENKVFKCLYNSFGTPSTVKPTLTQNTAFQTSDDYIWKYMYTITPTDMSKFASANYIPVSDNSAVVSSATDGIDVIQVESSGTGYTTFVTGTIQSVVNTSVVQIDNFASQDNQYYYNSALYITSGPGLGVLRTISRYVSNSTGNWVYTDSPINGLTPGISKYMISPRVQIDGDGTGAQAVAYVANNYSIANVSLIVSGSGYTRANVSVVANNAYGTGAMVTAFVAPPGGHGSDPVSELGASSVAFYTHFANTEGGYAPTEVAFRRYGLLCNPKDRSGNPYTADKFDATLRFTTASQAVLPIGMTISGNGGAQGLVVFSNSSVNIIQGDRDFNQDEAVTAANAFYNTSITGIVRRNDIDVNTPDILHINNTSPIQRANTLSETIKFVIQV